MPQVGSLTIDDFEQLPDALALNHELVDGELVDVSGNTGKHIVLQDLLILFLLGHVRANKLGSVLSEQEYEFEDNAHGPDVTFFGPNKTHLFEPDMRVQRFVPDLAIEIVSRNDKFSALMEKARRYRRCGTQDVWILNSDLRQAFLFSEQGDAILDENGIFQSALIPGFSIRLGDLFDQI